MCIKNHKHKYDLLCQFHFNNINYMFFDFVYRAKVIFGLNALSGREIGSDGGAVGAWNSSNAESLIRYTVNKGYPIYGWELGW